MDVSPEVFPITPEVERIGRAIARAGGRPILVGGWVRDCLLGIPHSKDFDIEVFSLSTKKLQSVLKGFGPLHTVGRHFGVLKLTTRQAEYDVSVPRRESKIGKGHREFHVVADPRMPFEAAAARRDFTINAMGYAYLEGRILDPHGGQADLEARVLRHTSPAFGEDPLRVLRAMQFAGRFDMTVAPETLEISRQQDLSELPRERLWEEFRKLLLQANAPAHGLRYAEPLGVLPYFPELAALAAAPPPGEGAPSPWEQTLAVVDRAAAHRSGAIHTDLELMTAALTHLFGWPALERPEGTDDAALAQAAEAPVRAFLERLTRERGFADHVIDLIRDLPTPDRLYAARNSGTDPEVRRLAIRLKIPLLVRLARARHEARAGRAEEYPAGEWLLERARALDVFGLPPEPLLKGRHLLELGLPPGPHLGPLLKEAFERQLEGELGTLDEALAWARNRLEAAS